MNRLLLTGLLIAAAITANAQDDAQKDSLTMETMMHNIPEVMVKRALCNSCCTADIVNSSVRIPMREEQILCRIKNALSRLPGLLQ